ncbi:Translation machinery-associated protein 7 [Coemansia sp. RSA 2049]|nr:Translation machinery-associated protein 7 [Coemansia sp. RSA 2049]
MAGREGGKKKPLKQAKKGQVEYDDDDKMRIQKEKEAKKLLADAQQQALKKGPMATAGIKKSKK